MGRPPRTAVRERVIEEFGVEGTTLLGRTVRVQPHTKGEARDEAKRIVKWLDMAPAVSYTAHHRIVRCRHTDPEKD
jgi:hypothetical protein